MALLLHQGSQSLDEWARKTLVSFSSPNGPCFYQSLWLLLSGFHSPKGPFEQGLVFHLVGATSPPILPIMNKVHETVTLSWLQSQDLAQP